MEWKTKISKSDKDGTIIRGYELEDLIKNVSFTEAIFLILKGSLPSKEQKVMLDAILTSSIDHGIEPSSAFVARSVAGAGNQFNSSVAAGVGTLGKYHGGAIEDCAKVLEKVDDVKAFVKDSVENKKRIGGFGHKMYTTDPRTQVLMEIAKENKVFGKYCEIALEIEKELEVQKGKKLCLNIDGAIAAIILDLGFPSSLGNAFFIISRTVGLCAHVNEELTEEKPVRRLNESKYLGEENKKI